MIILWKETKENLKRSLKRKGGSRKKINSVDSSEKRFSPKFGGQRRLKKKRANNVVDCSNRSFCFSILLRSVRTRETNCNAVGLKISKKKTVIKFASIITLKRLNVSFKLIFDIHSKVTENRINFRFCT